MWLSNSFFTCTATLLLVGFNASLASSSNTCNTTANGAAPLLPYQDPFYQPPATFWQKTAPGTILKSRKVTIGPLAGTPTPIQAAYQLLYRTTDASSNPSTAVTTILIPHNANFSRLLSYQAAYDSADNNCSPSYGLQYGASTHAASTTVELSQPFSILLAQGWCVSVPDYEGGNAAWTVGTQSGYSVLDSIRAALKSKKLTGISSSAITTMVGYSGGSIGGEWAAELQSSYAPELRIAGAAIGGLPANITEALLLLDSSPFAGLIYSAFNGIANAFPSFAAYIEKHLLPCKADMFRIPVSQCQSDPTNPDYGFLPELANATLASFFDNGDSIIHDQAHTFNSIGVMGNRGIPKFPLFIFQGTADVVVGTQALNNLVPKYCAAGAKIDYYRVLNGTHTSAIAPALPFAMKFLAGLYDGVAPTKCTTTEIPA